MSSLIQRMPRGITYVELFKHFDIQRDQDVWVNDTVVSNHNSLVPESETPLEICTLSQGSLKVLRGRAKVVSHPLMATALKWVQRDGCCLRTQHADPRGGGFVQDVKCLHFLERSRTSPSLLLHRGSAYKDRIYVPRWDGFWEAGTLKPYTCLNALQDGGVNSFYVYLTLFTFPDDPIPHTSLTEDMWGIINKTAPSNGFPVMDQFGDVRLWAEDGMGVNGTFHKSCNYEFRDSSSRKLIT